MLTAYLNEIGRVISQTCGIDCTAATAVKVLIQRSNGSGFTKLAPNVVVDDAATGQVHWTSETGELWVTGEYFMQVKFEFAGSKVLYGPMTSFEVEGVVPGV